MKKLATLAMGFMLSMSVMANTAYEQGLYYYDLGTDDGYRQAFSYFSQAAEQGDSEAQLKLGYMYYHGYGVRQDYKQAFNWYAKAAAQNEPIAQYNIGNLYEHGQGVRQSYSLAKEWYGKACDLGEQQGCDEYRRLNDLGY